MMAVLLLIGWLVSGSCLGLLARLYARARRSLNVVGRVRRVYGTWLVSKGSP